MSRITAIRAGKNSRQPVRVFLDGQPSFRLEAEVVARHSLHVGQELSDTEIATLADAERHQRCLNAAYRYLQYRPRSQFELTDKLRQRGFSEDTIHAVIARLKEQRLVDDTAFAQFWKENRQIFSPRSQWLTGLELRRKGVPADIIEDAVRDADDLDNAYRAASARARRLPLTDREGFRRRLGEFLKRRGFSYGVISDTVRRLWQEMGEPDQSPALPDNQGQQRKVPYSKRKRGDHGHNNVLC